MLHRLPCLVKAPLPPLLPFPVLSAATTAAAPDSQGDAIPTHTLTGHRFAVFNPQSLNCCPASRNLGDDNAVATAALPAVAEHLGQVW